MGETTDPSSAFYDPTTADNSTYVNTSQLYDGIDLSATGGTVNGGYGLSAPVANANDYGLTLSDPANLYGTDTSAINDPSLSGLTYLNSNGLPSSSLDTSSSGGLLGAAATAAALAAATVQKIASGTQTTGLTVGGTLTGGGAEGVMLLGAAVLIAFLVLAKK